MQNNLESDADFNNQTQQQRIAALLEAAGIPPHGVDGALLRNPAVLDHLSSSVNKALIDAKLAMNKADFDDNIRGLGNLSFPEKSDNSYTSLKKALRALNGEDYQEYLTQSCTDGSYELVQLLLNLDNIPERMDSEKVKAVYHQYHKVNFQRFQSTGEERAQKGEMTPLMEAAYNGHEDIVTLLINHGVDINAKSSTGNTALMYACCRGYESIVHNLLCAGANTEIFNENGHTPLMEAASGAHVNCAKLLVCHGAEINCASNEFKESALTLACYKGNYDMVRFLLSAGADREHKTDEMHTALMEASMDGHTDVARLLLDSGCNVNMPPDSFESPLTLAACGGHTELARLLIERGANLEEVNDEGYTALMEAAREGHEKVVQVLIDHGANVNQQTEETQETALTLACCAGFNDCARLLIEAGANIEKGASTPLMEAAQEGYDDLVDFLIKSSAKVTAVANNGDTALDLAAENGHKKICDALLGAGAKLEHRSEGGRTPLMRAARQGHESTVDYLIDAGANVNLYSENNEHTVLSFACSNGQIGVVQRLLHNGANPNAKLKDNSTMLIEAAKGGHTQVVSLLLDPNRAGPRYVLNQEYQEQRSEEIDFDEVVDVLNSVKEMIGQPVEGVLPSPIGVEHTSLDQLATNAKEAQKRLEALELKIKSAFDQKQDGTTNQEILAKEIAQIQKEKKHKQNLMRELQDVEAQIHKKMLDKVSKTIPKNIEKPTDVIYPPDPLKDATPYPNWPKTGITDNVFEDHIRPEDIPDLLNLEKDSWGFSPEELNEIMKHIQVLGPAIQKAIQRHLQNPTPVPEPKNQPPQRPPVEKPLPVEQQQPTAVRSKSEEIDPVTCSVGITSETADPLDEPPIADGINDKTDSNHDTPLSLACQGGHTELVQLLVSKGAELEHRDKKGFTPLILAATGGFSEICELLIEAGADVEAQSDRTKDTPLSLACSGGKKEVVELLLERAAKKEHRNVSDYTPLSLAASGGYIEIIKILLDAGAEINSRTASKLGISPLMLAAMNGHLEAVTLLLDRGADINAQIETNKNTALTLACFQGRAEVVETLLDRRANVEHRAKTGLTPLMEAASGGYVDVGRVLLEKGADVNALPVPSSRDTALTIASDKGHKAFVDLLLRYHAHVDIRNKKGDTPIWLASHSGHLDVVKKLIEHKADPSLCDTRNVSPLMAAFKKGHLKVVKHLVQKVTQFPSDTECYNYIQSIKDKDQDLKMKCASCVEIIIQAKVKQEKEAERHAKELLQRIEQENLTDDKKRRKKEENKRKRKEKQENKKIAFEQEDKPIIPEKPTTPPKYEPLVVEILPPHPPPPAIEVPSTSQKKNSKGRKAPEQVEVKAEPKPAEDPADRVLREMIERTEAPQPEPEQTKKTSSSKKKEQKRPLKVAKAEQVEPQPVIKKIADIPEQAADWNVVKPVKKPVQKLTLSSNLIARVIGRSGCNVNAIRDVTQTHIDIEKPKKGGGDRTITIRGNNESTAMAKKLMDELINNPDMEIDDIISRLLPDIKMKKEKVVETEKVEDKGLNLQKILAAVEANEKKQREKEEELQAKKKMKQEDQRVKEQARVREERERERFLPIKTTSLPPTPRIKVKVEQPPSHTPDVKQKQLDEAVSRHLQQLRKRDEMEQERKKVEVVQKPLEVKFEQPPPTDRNAPPPPQMPTTEQWKGMQHSSIDPLMPAKAHPGPIGPPKARDRHSGAISPYAPSNFQPQERAIDTPQLKSFPSPGQVQTPGPSPRQFNSAPVQPPVGSVNRRLDFSPDENHPEPSREGYNKAPGPPSFGHPGQNMAQGHSVCPSEVGVIGPSASMGYSIPPIGSKPIQRVPPMPPMAHEHNPVSAFSDYEPSPDLLAKSTVPPNWNKNPRDDQSFEPITTTSSYAENYPTTHPSHRGSTSWEHPQGLAPQATPQLTPAQLTPSQPKPPSGLGSSLSENFRNDGLFRAHGRTLPQVQNHHSFLPSFDGSTIPDFGPERPMNPSAIGSERRYGRQPTVSNMSDQFMSHPSLPVPRPIQKPDWEVNATTPRSVTGDWGLHINPQRWSQAPTHPFQAQPNMSASPYMPSGGGGDPAMQQLRPDFMSPQQQIRMDGPSLLDRNVYYRGFPNPPPSSSSFGHQWSN